ncbi:MAG: bifunctional phosphoribosylaminoimidazolecarboxamide formyltransferase/IMP cyclohydrolase [Flavobacteriales bacterium]|jgi:phosphoribosylaminoimidazolecarboxamide formyltransferase/IMP cyclohydrolase|nr:bifunctional phosphoribosylaminoimidazolecarboxamide formyltransferase/IMP cyclohydrolase [Flavobacteriales bacterium]
MSETRKIKSALISVFSKDGLDELALELHRQGVQIYSTGGTQVFLENLGIKVNAVESLTSYPSILGGRVKTLHPKVFGGILSRRSLDSDVAQLEEYEIPEIDLVVVDLYPFEDTVKSGASHEDIIEKIDIGGISLIRAAAKNYKDVLTLSSKEDYQPLLDLLKLNGGETTIDQRKNFAMRSFDVSSHYDSSIYNYFSDDKESLKVSLNEKKSLRYGENPHQKGAFYGDLSGLFNQLHGKELSYNNLLDVDAAVNLMNEFKGEAPTFAILKHNNACGFATRNDLATAYEAALAGDPVSAFGGILISNRKIDVSTAEKINQLFCEVVIADQYDNAALEILKSKKNRIILEKKEADFSSKIIRTCLNGIIVQERDLITDVASGFSVATSKSPSVQEELDLVFANKLVKHTKSNTIVLAKDGQLLASGTGQTSRVDALNQAIHKAKSFNFDLNGAVMASDAFFPFPDCVEIASKEGIKAVVQPGGSIKDQLSIDYCNNNEVSMVFTGNRHFKH